jgi:c(7)-type cytochrome triheme protein
MHPYTDAVIESNSSRKRFKKWLAVVFAAALASLFFASMFVEKGEAAAQAKAKKPARGSSLDQALARKQAPDNSRFNHTSAKHSQMKCDQCHTRRADAIKPVMPGHRACIACHIKEFTSTGFSICANCHDGIAATQPKVLEFPERQSFGTEFSHKTHATYQSGEKRADCSDCHAVAGARTTFPAHRECYVCHKAPELVKAGEKVGGASCGECHTPSGNRSPHSAMSRAYNFRFTHQVHAQRENIKCSECHNVLGESNVQVSVPQLREHLGAGFQSCGACHNGRRAFSGDAQGNCARCHGRPMM